MTTPTLNYYRVRYSWPGGQAHTVTAAASMEQAAGIFARQNPHVKVLNVEDGTTGAVLNLEQSKKGNPT